VYNRKGNMKSELHKLILIYTIQDDNVRNQFLNSIREKYSGCKELDQSTYALNTNDVNNVATEVGEIYNKYKLDDNSEHDYISLIYSPYLKNYTYKSKGQLECVVEQHIVGKKDKS